MTLLPLYWGLGRNNFGIYSGINRCTLCDIEILSLLDYRERDFYFTKVEGQK